MRERTTPATAYLFKNEVLTEFVFRSSDRTRSRCALTDELVMHWSSCMATGIPPSKPYSFFSWENFERYVQRLFDERKRTVQALRQLENRYRS